MKQSQLKKVLLLALVVMLLAGTGQVQRALNRDRDRLGLTRAPALENAPPVLAFTTVALGGFRGLIASALWMRATDLQDDGKYFEMVQLADWITKLEPHYVQVWLVQAWNMAYNISVKFKEVQDRWRWVQRGIALLRDDGLRYNPNEVLIYRELGWFFQHKMGMSLDDAHKFYKLSWYREMMKIFDGPRPNFDELIDPQTDDAKARARLLREKYKLDPRFMKEVNERYGPLEWRLPEAHAIYWAALGLEQARKDESRVDQEQLIQLRRMICQSMQLSFQRGRVIPLPGGKGFDLGPNLEIISKVNAAYEQLMEEDAKDRDLIARGHRNFLRDAVYFLYIYRNRQPDAAQWYRYLTRKYPDKPLLDQANSLPGNLTLYEYCLARVSEDVGETNEARIRNIVGGLLATSFTNQAMGEDDSAEVYYGLAQQVYARYQKKVADRPAIVLPPLKEIQKDVLNELLDPERGLPPELQAVLRTIYGPPATTNAPPAASAGSSK